MHQDATWYGEVGLSPGDFVLDGDSAPPQKRGQSRPIFGRCLLWPKGWMDQDATWYGSKPNPGPGDVVLDGVVALPKRGTAPSFRSMSIVAKRLDG